MGCCTGGARLGLGSPTSVTSERCRFGAVAVESLVLMSPRVSSVLGRALGDGSGASLGCDTPAMALAVL